MPANYTRFPNSEVRVFRAAPSTAPCLRADLTLDREVLAAHGSLTVPGHIWRTLQRLGPWVEPVLVDEWRALCALTANGWVVSYRMAKSKLHSLGSTRPEILFSHDQRLSACSSKDGRSLACGPVHGSVQECWTLITACLGRSDHVAISGICFQPHRGSIST